MNARNVATQLALLVLSSSAFAQTQTTGRIAGTVRDERGAVIVGAEVSAVSHDTGEERRVTTEAAGGYAIAFLTTGIYRVSIAATGFKRAS